MRCAAPPGAGTSVPITYRSRPAHTDSGGLGFGDGEHADGARGDDLVGEGAVVVGTGIAAIEVQFGVAGRDIAADQFVDMRHRGRGRPIPPAIRAEVIAAQHDALDREPDTVSDPLDERAEIGRTHSGVAAGLVHLVGGGLDQYDLTARPAVLEGRFDDEGVG